MALNQTVVMENQRQVVEEMEPQGRRFLSADEEDRFMELVVFDEQAERVITGALTPVAEQKLAEIVEEHFEPNPF